MHKSHKVMVLFILFIAPQIILLSINSTNAWTPRGSYFVVVSGYEAGKDHTLNWDYIGTNYYGTTGGVYLELWLMNQEQYMAWDKVDTDNMPGQLLSSGSNDIGEYRVTTRDTWYVILHLKTSSLDANVSHQIKLEYDPIINHTLKISLIMLSSIALLSGIFVPLSISWWKKSKSRRILRQSNKEALIQDSIRETLEQIGSTTPVSLDRIIDYTREILKDKAKNDSTINLIQSRELTKSVCENNISLILAQNVDLGEYFKVEQVFVKSSTESMDATRKTIDCYFCGSPLGENKTACPSCKEKVITCSVCKLPITFGESVGKCSLCENKAHLAHIQEWVKAKGKCPNCLQEIPHEGILTEDSPNEKKK